MSEKQSSKVVAEPAGELYQALRAYDEAAARLLLQDLHPSEIAAQLEGLPPKERGRAWALVAPERSGEVLAELDDMVRTGLLEDMPPQEVGDITCLLETDDAVDILQDLPKKRIDNVLRSMDEQNRKRLASVLRYPEDSAGGLMNTDVTAVRGDVDMETVGRYLHRLGELPGTTDRLMVVDRDNHFLGALPLVNLVTAEAGQLVSEHLDDETQVLNASMPTEQVIKLFVRHGMISAPVVDEQGTLLGRITVDDILDLVQDQADRAARHKAGLPGKDDMFAPPLTHVRRRTAWLGINLLTAFLAAWVIGIFEESIQQLVALAVLMPVVASMGGIAASQTLTIAVRGLALGRLGWANAVPLIRQELATGTISGVVWAVVVAVIATTWLGDLGLGVVMGLAIFFNLAVAALAGALTPLLLKSCHIDPAIAGGVVVTTVTDVIGFMSFLGLGTLLLL